MEQLINFLNEKQRDPRMNEILYPLYDEKRSQEIIDTYEQNEEARTTSKFQSSELQIFFYCFIPLHRNSYQRWFHQIFNVR